jgi:hypothetical protein
MSATIMIQVTSGQDLGNGYRRFDPGSTITGNVQIMPEQSFKCREASMWVEWHTEGRGDRDSGKGTPIILGQGELQAGIPIQQPFSLTLPPQPWSYSGHYVNIIWELKVQIDIPWGKDINYTLNFLMRPGETAQQPATPDPFASPFDTGYDPFAKEKEDPYDPFPS